MDTGAGLHKTASSCLARSQRRQNQNSITCLALNQGYLTIYISAWFLLQTVPPSLEENYPLMDHTHVYRSICNAEQPIGAPSLSSYPGQTSCLSVFGLCYRLVWEFTEPLCKKYDTVSCGEKTHKISLRSATHNVCKLNMTNVLKSTRE